MTVSIMAFNIMGFNIMAVSILGFSIIILSIKGLFAIMLSVAFLLLYSPSPTLSLSLSLSLTHTHTHIHAATPFFSCQIGLRVREEEKFNKIKSISVGTCNRLVKNEI